MPDCPDCPNGDGWIWAGPTRCLDGVIRLIGWVACASCNDDASRPKPHFTAIPDEALN